MNLFRVSFEHKYSCIEPNYKENRMIFYYSFNLVRLLKLLCVRCNHREVRETVEDLGNDVKFIEPLLRGCEQELGLHPPHPVVVPSSSGDSSFRQRLEALKRQRESNGN